MFIKFVDSLKLPSVNTDLYLTPEGQPAKEVPAAPSESSVTSKVLGSRPLPSLGEIWITRIYTTLIVGEPGELAAT